jgi:hypothetical protein
VSEMHPVLGDSRFIARDLLDGADLTPQEQKSLTPLGFLDFARHNRLAGTGQEHLPHRKKLSAPHYALNCPPSYEREFICQNTQRRLVGR